MLVGALVLVPRGAVARSCSDAYFGVSAPADRAEAYRCFDALRAEAGAAPVPDLGVSPYAPLVVLRLGGAGVPEDLDEAAALLREWREREQAPSEQRLYLTRVVLERRSGLATDRKAPIRLCELPGGESFQSACANAKRGRDEREREALVARLGEGLTEPARTGLAGVSFSFSGYRAAEEERVRRLEVLAGAEEDLEAQDPSAPLEAGFEEALRRVLELDEDPAPAPAEDAGGAEARLQQAIRDDRDRRQKEFLAYGRALPDARDRYERAARSYDEAARTATAAWARYRDAWLHLVALMKAEEGEEKGRDARAARWEASVRNLLAAQRIQILAPTEPGAPSSTKRDVPG